MRRLLLAEAFAPLALPAAAMPSDYATLDQAAVAFVELARSYPEQRKEYCAWILKTPQGRFRWGVVNEGDFNRCPSQWPKPAGTVGSVHTHPIAGGPPQGVDAAGQVFSEGDFAHAEHPEVSVPTFLGAPAGHVLRYDPGGSLCRGRSFITRRFRVVRDLSPSVLGRLPINPGERRQLFDPGGNPQPRPAYCRDE
jgi:hypothetical protein